MNCNEGWPIGSACTLWIHNSRTVKITILTYIILSNLNDIKADEFLALKNTASIALKACEYNDEVWKGIAKGQIDKQLDNGVFNDMLVRKNYGVLKQCIDTNSVQELPDIYYKPVWFPVCKAGKRPEIIRSR